MSFYTVDFGPELAGLPNVGLTQLQADGTVVVARTPAGVVALGLGVYGVALVPDAACAVLRWDSGADVPVYAHEGVDGQAAPSAADVAAAVLATLQVNALPVNMVQVKGQVINGAGTEANPWGP